VPWLAITAIRAFGTPHRRAAGGRPCSIQTTTGQLAARLCDFFFFFCVNVGKRAALAVLQGHTRTSLMFMGHQHGAGLPHSASRGSGALCWP